MKLSGLTHLHAIDSFISRILANLCFIINAQAFGCLFHWNSLPIENHINDTGILLIIRVLFLLIWNH